MASVRAYGQSNPLDAYKREGFEMFETMINGIKEVVVNESLLQCQKGTALERKSVAKNMNAAAM
jgi:preprotein translocase subunit SecA